MKKGKIEDMSIKEILKNYPLSESVFRAYGLFCVGCEAMIPKTLKELASIEGIDVKVLVKDLKRFIH